MLTIEGPLLKLLATAGDPVHYTLAVGGEAGRERHVHQLSLNGLIGTGLELRFLDRISCRFCAAVTRKSYGEGYCYACFKRLARCDLCIVSPDRCHYHQGTCREPEWGESFCMQPHIVYLANSSGPKVGITRAGHEMGRWMDQGASQALPILRATTRQMAGIAEVSLAAHLPDRTDWRALITADASSVDLESLRDELKSKLSVLRHGLPDGVDWIVAQPVTFRYPVRRYGHKARRLRLDDAPVISGNLMGLKGQFLLFEHGAFNVRQHTSYHVRVTAPGAAVDSTMGGSDQMELF